MDITMDTLFKGLTFVGTFDDVCKSKHASKYLELIKKLKTVQWRDGLKDMTENEVILCDMLEGQLVDEKALKGGLLLYVNSGPIYREIVKSLFRIYESYASI